MMIFDGTFKGTSFLLKSKEGEQMDLLDNIGNTPLVEISTLFHNQIYGKLESQNIFGSAKDRVAKYVIAKLLENNVINQHTEIIESSSGNMGVALAGVCNFMHLHATIFVDESIAPINEYLIRNMNAKIVKVTEADVNNSYLSARLREVNRYISNKSNVYWINQYGNPLIPEAYENTLGKELIQKQPDVDYVFLAVSSGGCINGVCNAAKKNNPNTKIIAVDIEGSKIFNVHTSIKKKITGIGSCIVHANMKSAKFDDYIIVKERESLEGLQSLLSNNGLFLGGSSGCVYAGMQRYVKEHRIENAKIICIFHDRGERYYNKIYHL